MKAATLLRELGRAVDALHVAIDHATLDHVTQPGKDNAATRANAFRANDAANYACGLLRETREAVRASPAPAHVRALARLERQLREITLNYLPDYLNALGDDDGRHAHH